MALHDDGPDSNETAAAVELPDPVARPPAAVAGIDAKVANLAHDVRLTGRERAVLRLIALGYRYREIGIAMSISPRTVKMYASNLRRKVGGSSRWDLMRRILAG